MSKPVLCTRHASAVAALVLLAGAAVVGACRPAHPAELSGRGGGLPAEGGHLCTLADRGELERQLERSIFAALPEHHKQMLLRGVGQRVSDGRVAVCFAPDTPDQVMQAFRYGVPGVFQARFQLGSRWGATALTPVAGGQGDPITITYSFVPDGTILPNEYGEGDLPSELFAWLNSVYGSQAAWQPLFTSIFSRWSELSGITYVYEPNDDGAAFPTTDGVAGVRGDVRISAKNIDGNSGILAYNYYPNPTAGEPGYGDMVINSFDSFFNTTSSNSLRFRNVVAHEAGHGLGAGHVCPIQTNKLMEPFAQTAYDGPRHDDIRFAQLNYGDANEPNDTQATATGAGALSAGGVTLGAVPAPAVEQGSTISLDGGGDVDYYSFTAGSATVVSATVSPLGFLYDDGAQACAGQNGSCCYGAFNNSSGAADFTVTLLDAGGAVLDSRTFLNTGAPISFRARVPAAGAYALRVSASAVANPPQLYTLGLASSTTPLVVDLTSAPGEVSAPATSMIVQARIRDGAQALNGATPTLTYRVGASDAVSVPMSGTGGGGYTALIPGAPCGQAVQYRVSAFSTSGTEVFAPAAGPASTAIGVLRTVFADDFETDRGWTATSTATAGAWTRVDPNGTAAAPEDDTTPAGTQCYVTGNGAAGEGVGTTDVDGGAVTLTSPVINASAYSNIRVSYQRWYTNVGGSAPAADTFRAEVSTNGGSTWTSAQTSGPGPVDNPDVQTGWRSASWTLASLGLTPTSQLRVRFVADDVGSGSVIEAGIDDFSVTGTDCVGVSACDSIDFNNDGLFPDTADIDDFLSVFSGGHCSNDPLCSDIDFNNDGLFPDTADIDSLLSVFSGGPCL
ncbi:MAG: matrixin family metalloprotease [Phycisphaerales bacterium]